MTDDGRNTCEDQDEGFSEGRHDSLFALTTVTRKLCQRCCLHPIESDLLNNGDLCTGGGLVTTQYGQPDEE